MYLRSDLWFLLLRNANLLHIQSTTVAWDSTRWIMKFVDGVRSTVLNRNLCWIFAERGLGGRLLKQTVLWTLSSSNVNEHHPASLTRWSCFISTESCDIKTSQSLHSTNWSPYSGIRIHSGLFQNSHSILSTIKRLFRFWNNARDITRRQRFSEGKYKFP